jgi:hypothetical protein
LVFISKTFDRTGVSSSWQRFNFSVHQCHRCRYGYLSRRHARRSFFFDSFFIFLFTDCRRFPIFAGCNERQRCTCPRLRLANPVGLIILMRTQSLYDSRAVVSLCPRGRCARWSGRERTPTCIHECSPVRPFARASLVRAASRLDLCPRVPRIHFSPPRQVPDHPGVSPAKDNIFSLSCSLADQTKIIFIAR